MSNLAGPPRGKRGRKNARARVVRSSRWPAGPSGAGGGEGESVSEVPFPVDGHRGDTGLGVPRMTRQVCPGSLHHDSRGSPGRFAKTAVADTTRTEGAGEREHAGPHAPPPGGEERRLTVTALVAAFSWKTQTKRPLLAHIFVSKVYSSVDPGTADPNNHTTNNFRQRSISKLQVSPLPIVNRLCTHTNVYTYTCKFIYV